ncbi:hypothetical protein CSKR_101833 [Clonorchis sinensis]|uniref:Uncharacterized protein n=1 Tax=Clonorchis sinensis TaxID=79923 RepID=A0A419QBN8_CLOSI|nr:hypothetical protein CSKR_101833 [Clonorchis sinensis]
MKEITKSRVLSVLLAFLDVVSVVLRVHGWRRCRIWLPNDLDGVVSLYLDCPTEFLEVYAPWNDCREDARDRVAGMDCCFPVQCQIVFGVGARRPKWLERELTDRKIRGSNPTSAFRIPLSRLGQPGSIPALLGTERLLQLNDFLKFFLELDAIGYNDAFQQAFSLSYRKSACTGCRISMTSGATCVGICATTETAMTSAAEFACNDFHTSLPSHRGSFPRKKIRSAGVRSTLPS